MASLTKIQLDNAATIPITLSSLATGAGRWSDAITNSNARPGALVFVRIKSGGSAPTVDTTYDVYLLRRDKSSSPTYGTDGWAGSDAAATRVKSAKWIGSVVVTANTATEFDGEFDTGLAGPLGEVWGIAVVNNTGQTTDTTAGNHVVTYRTYYAEAQ